MAPAKDKKPSAAKKATAIVNAIRSAGTPAVQLPQPIRTFARSSDFSFLVMKD
jgi:hypothetical protein